MRNKTIKNSFSSGEISPLLRGRTDIQQYAEGVEELSNFLIRQQGGISKRPGTRYIGEVLDQTNGCRLHRFVFNNETAYVLELTNTKIRILKNEDFVKEGDVTITGATQANPVVVTATSHGYTDGDIVTISSVGGMTEINNREFIVTNSNPNDFELYDIAGNALDGTGYSTYTTGGVSNKHIVFTTPYSTTDIEGLTFAQTNDVLYVASESYAPRKITRTSDTAWSIATMDYKDGPYGAENTGDTTLTPAATTGTGITLTASADTFVSTDVGRHVRLHHTAASPIVGWAKVASYVSATEVTIDIESDFGSTSATNVWRLGAWSETTGYSGTVTFHENRLFFGGTSVEPSTFWASKTDDYNNFEPTGTDLTVLDNNGLRFQIASEQSNSIQWMRSGPILFIGTKGGQYAVRSSGAAIIPSDVNVSRQNGYGASIIEPYLISNSLIYVDRTTRKIMEMVYNYDTDNYESHEISVIANHILRQGVRAIYTSYRQSPDNVIWYVLESGRLVGMTYLKEQKLIAFHNHDVGGRYESETVSSGLLIEGETYIIKSASGGADFTTVGASSNTIGVEFTATNITPTWGTGSLARITNAEANAITTVPSALEQTDITYIAVRRTINSSTKQYIEYFTDDEWADHDQDKDDFFFLDSGRSYDGTATTTISGLWHLEGETVSIVGDGAKLPDETVSGGQITVDESVEKASVGYSYTASCKTLPLDLQGDIGSSQGSLKRVSKVIVRVWNSLGCQVGEKTTNLDDIVFRESDDRMDLSPPLFTGDKTVLTNMDYNTEGGMYIQQDKPFPLNLLYVTYEIRSNL
jgi:hypothetical protein